MDFTHRYESAYTRSLQCKTCQNTTHFKAAILYLGLCVWSSHYP